MDFKPKSEKELSDAMLAPKGEYDFDVLAAEDTVSKKRNPMIKLKIGLYRGDAMSNHVYDYLLPSMEAKLRHFCDTTGLLAKYEDGTLCAEDCRGRSGRVKIIIEDEGDFPPKNVVKDYICRKAKPLGEQVNPPTEEDDVPF